MITTRVHAVIDYLAGLLLIVAPLILGFADGGPEQWVPQALGVFTLVVSLLTRYELSIAKLIPFPVHLILDLVQAAILILSPWIFGFAGRTWWPHVLVGVVELVVIALSWRSRPLATTAT